MRASALVLAVAIAASVHVLGTAQAAGERYLSWSAAQAEAVGRQMYQKGRVGGIFDTRLLKTERSYNYKLAATWLTPDVVRATARLLQLRSRLTDVEARALVEEADRVAGTVVMVEIDPREGSGVIPNDWEAFLQPVGRPEMAVRGEANPQLRRVKALAGVLQRNYDYDRFWVVFRLKTPEGEPLFSERDQRAELVVRIYQKEGHVEWPIPESVRR